MSTPAHIFRCKHCQTPLGVTVGSVLQMGTGKVERPQKIQCVVCSRHTYWMPDRVTGQLPEIVPAAQVS